ncbi:MAG: hypothetical protein JXA37_09790 [Chloroflexia bacterium]|nr:hypothetical protein [Chloroflexia bacterium]
MKDHPYNSSKAARWGVPLPTRGPLRGGKPEGEQDMVQQILQTAPSPIAREFLLHYYISAKSWPLVLLVAPPKISVQSLFYLLAEGIAGCSEGQIRLLSARFPQAAESNHFNALQGRFSAMALLDLLAEASLGGNEGRAYFLCLDQMTPSELDGYIELDVSQQTGPDGASPLPVNFSLTAILPIEGGAWGLPPVLLDQVGVVEVTVPLKRESHGGQPFCPPVGRQRLFLRSILRDPQQARLKLQGLGLGSLFDQTLAGLQDQLPVEITPPIQNRLLLYVANSFSLEGASLLARSKEAGFYRALDIQLSQALLPCLEQSAQWQAPQWQELIEHLARRFPLAQARARRLLIAGSTSRLVNAQA